MRYRDRTGRHAGLLLFYDEKLYCGLGFDEQRFVTHQYGIERGRPANPHGRRMTMRVTNNRHIVSFHPAAMAARPGSASTGAWKCRAITTMSAAAS
jgi:xylan 1,4-beta-xylosidase